MTLENLVFDAEGGVKIKLKPELVVDSDDFIFSFASVPVTVLYHRKNKKGHLTYDLHKQIFITALTDFFPEATSYNHEHVLGAARIYSALLEQGHIKVREIRYNSSTDKYVDYKVYNNFKEYLAEMDDLVR